MTEFYDANGFFLDIGDQVKLVDDGSYGYVVDFYKPESKWSYGELVFVRGPGRIYVETKDGVEHEFECSLESRYSPHGLMKVWVCDDIELV